MAYITISNSKKIMQTLSEITLDEIETAVYRKDIYFFSRKERGMLKGIREFIRDPENFRAQYYRPIIVEDSLKYVYPESQPSYHKDDQCIRLHSNFINFEIPFEIQEQGEASVKKFRNWFAENKNLLEVNAKTFIEKMQARFLITAVINPKSIQFNNSGSKEEKNYSIQNLENEIDSILRDAASFYRNNPDKQDVIRRYGKLTFLAYVHGDIYTNDSGLNDSDLKDFLKMYNEKFKKPVKNLLLEYYRLLYNPDMTFSDTLLDKLGFRPCGSCLDNYYVDSFIKCDDIK